MNAVADTICDGGRVICRKQDELYNLINYAVILTNFIKPSVSALGQPLRKRDSKEIWREVVLKPRYLQQNLGSSKLCAKGAKVRTLAELAL